MSVTHCTGCGAKSLKVHTQKIMRGFYHHYYNGPEGKAKHALKEGKTKK